MFSRKEIIIGIFVAFLGMVLAYSCRLEAGEWNEKPVMCASEEETLQSLNTKGEKLLYMVWDLLKLEQKQA